jgi:hypothetical protein
MNLWTSLILLSALTGGICGLVFRGRIVIITGAAIPWFGMLVWLLYNEYFVPYQGGGASMWPIAQLFGGTIAAVIGAAVAVSTRFIRNRYLP